VRAAVCTRDCEIKLGIFEIGNGKPSVLQGYIDADYARDLDQQRSTTSYIFTIAECIISWKVKLQDTMALSTTEMEHMAQLRHRKPCG